MRSQAKLMTPPLSFLFICFYLCIFFFLFFFYFYFFCNSKVSSKEEQYKVLCLLEALFFPNVSAFDSLLQRKLLTFCKLYILSVKLR